ncbi:MAG: hypothetical protein U0232_24545 [Thermomicrobiales bacterium]
MTLPHQRPRWRRPLSLLLTAGMLLSLLIAALPAGATPNAAAAIPTPVTSGVPRFEPGPCVWALPQGINDGQQIICGHVVVAEKHANPGGKTIRLPVGIVKATGANPAPEPIFLLAGGPGQSGQVFADLLTPSIRGAAPSRRRTTWSSGTSAAPASRSRRCSAPASTPPPTAPAGCPA